MVYCPLVLTLEVVRFCSQYSDVAAVPPPFEWARFPSAGLISLQLFLEFGCSRLESRILSLNFYYSPLSLQSILIAPAVYLNHTYGRSVSTAILAELSGVAGSLLTLLVRFFHIVLERLPRF